MKKAQHFRWLLIFLLHLRLHLNGQGGANKEIPKIRVPVVCMLAWPGVLKGLKLLIAQFSFSGVKMLSVNLSCFTWALEHIRARIGVSADSEPGKWVSNSRFKDSFSLSVQEISAFVNRQDGCGLIERNFRILKTSAADICFRKNSSNFFYWRTLSLFCKIEGISYSLPSMNLIS